LSPSKGRKASPLLNWLKKHFGKQKLRAILFTQATEREREREREREETGTKRGGRSGGIGTGRRR